MRFLLLSVCLAMQIFAQQRRLIVISVDGLDYRYLRDADKLGLRIPALRKLMKMGETTKGIVGAVPTVTWPSHTTLITGVPPREHGILGNRRNANNSGDYYWMADMLKVRTLWHATRKAGLKSAAITWPVTVGADIDFNLPEYFRSRQGGSMDYISVFEKATPGLMERIEKFDPTFRQTWIDDRTRKVAAVYLLKHEAPDLMLLHFVELDSVAHEHGPFSKDANAELEKTDGYIAEILSVASSNTVVCLTSDHGFQRVDRDLNIGALATQVDATAKLGMLGGLLTTTDTAVAQRLRDSKLLGREVPMEEILDFAPEAAQQKVVAAFEPKTNESFAIGAAELYSAPHERGNHGFWPGTVDYRSVLILTGRGFNAESRPEAGIESIASRLARILGVVLER